MIQSHVDHPGENVLLDHRVLEQQHAPNKYTHTLLTNPPTAPHAGEKTRAARRKAKRDAQRAADARRAKPKTHALADNPPKRPQTHNAWPRRQKTREIAVQTDEKLSSREKCLSAKNSTKRTSFSPNESESEEHTDRSAMFAKFR